MVQPPVARSGPSWARSACFSVYSAMRSCLRGLARLGAMVLQHSARCAHMLRTRCTPGTLRMQSARTGTVHTRAVANLAFGIVRCGNALLYGVCDAAACARAAQNQISAIKCSTLTEPCVRYHISPHNMLRATFYLSVFRRHETSKSCQNRARAPFSAQKTPRRSIHKHKSTPQREPCGPCQLWYGIMDGAPFFGGWT